MTPLFRKGQTVFAGTRIPLETLWGYRTEASTVDEFLEDYHIVERWQAQNAWQWDDQRIEDAVSRGAGSTL